MKGIAGRASAWKSNYCWIIHAITWFKFATALTDVGEKTWNTLESDFFKRRRLLSWANHALTKCSLFTRRRFKASGPAVISMQLFSTFAHSMLALQKLVRSSLVGRAWKCTCLIMLGEFYRKWELGIWKNGRRGYLPQLGAMSRLTDL